MSGDGEIIITDIGHAKITAAVGSQTVVEITHVAMGDGNGAVYAPGFGQVSLKREKARVAITRRHLAGDNAWRITAEFDADTTPTFWVREIGFIDAEGDLIFLWAGSNVDARQTGVIDYLLDHALAMDRIKNGVVIVNAPDDALFEYALIALRENASQRLAIFNLNEGFRAQHGHYPGAQL